MITRNHFILFVMAMMFLGLVGCTMQNQNRGMPTAYTRHTLIFDGQVRQYLLNVPPGEPSGMILALHGGGGSARSMCAMPGGLAQPAYRAGFLLVCPEGFDRHWNDGRNIQTWEAHAQEIDDVGFLTAVIEQLSQQYPIDPGMIFAAGISNGGQMSYRLACEKSEVLRAIAPVVASMATSLNCKPNAPVSVMVINGTADPLVPYDGGEIRAFRHRLGSVSPTSQVVEFWVDHNDCAAETIREEIADLDPGDGTRIFRMKHEDCRGSAQVILYEVAGGGHTWPGATQYLPQFLIGRLSRDMNASEVIIDFFTSLRETSGS